MAKKRLTEREQEWRDDQSVWRDGRRVRVGYRAMGDFICSVPGAVVDAWDEAGVFAKDPDDGDKYLDAGKLRAAVEAGALESNGTTRWFRDPDIHYVSTRVASFIGARA